MEHMKNANESWHIFFVKDKISRKHQLWKLQWPENHWFPGYPMSHQFLAIFPKNILACSEQKMWLSEFFQVYWTISCHVPISAQSDHIEYNSFDGQRMILIYIGTSICNRIDPIYASIIEVGFFSR